MYPLWALLLLLLSPLGAARAQPEPPADPPTLPYRLVIAPSGDGALDAALAAVAQLATLRGRAPTDAAGLLARAEGDRPRLVRALESEGYWGGSVGIELAGMALGPGPAGPEFADRLVATDGEPILVRILPVPGPRYRLGRVAFRGVDNDAAEVAIAAAAAGLPLAPGDPARAALVIAAERGLLDRLLDAGHPLARLAPRRATVFHDRAELDVELAAAPGPQARFAAPRVNGTVRMDAGFVRRIADDRLNAETFSPARLEAARVAIQRLGAFASVRPEPAAALDAEGRLPVTFTVVERPLRAVGGALAFETNYGLTTRAYWEHRNLFGRAERLRIEGEVARLGQAEGVGNGTYRGGVSLRQPGLPGPRDTLTTAVSGFRERLEAYDRDAITASVTAERPLRDDRLVVRAGPLVDFGAAGPRDGTLIDYQVLGATGGARLDRSNSLLDPTRGYRLDASITPLFNLAEGQPFAPTRLIGTTYIDLTGAGTTVLALRAGLGSLLGAGRSAVPQHYRFYAGGGGSVRGYDYQSIGPRDARGRPAGGASLAELAAELRTPIRGAIGGAVFVDAGTVGTGSLPDASNLRFAVGVGVRYRTAIGPIRADVAVPLVRQQGSSGFGVYLGIGQPF